MTVALHFYVLRINGSDSAELTRQPQPFAGRKRLVEFLKRSLIGKIAVGIAVYAAHTGHRRTRINTLLTNKDAGSKIVL